MSLFTPKTVTLKDGSCVLLRSPREDEAQALIDYLKAVRAETDGIMSDPADVLPTLDEERRWVRTGNQSDHGLHLLAEHAGQIIALSDILQPKFTRQQHMAGLGISIRSNWCGRGLGSLMMRELVNRARSSQELEMLTLSVFADNIRAISVYRKLGFQDDGVLPRRAKVDGKYRDIIVMSLWLDEMAVAS